MLNQEEPETIRKLCGIIFLPLSHTSLVCGSSFEEFSSHAQRENLVPSSGNVFCSFTSLYSSILMMIVQIASTYLLA